MTSFWMLLFTTYIENSVGEGKGRGKVLESGPSGATEMAPARQIFLTRILKSTYWKIRRKLNQAFVEELQGLSQSCRIVAMHAKYRFTNV